jgi:serine/threonine-protein kinase
VRSTVPSVYHLRRVNAFSAMHVAFAVFCGLMALLHAVMWAALRDEPAHRWVFASFTGFTLLNAGIAGASVGAEGSLGPAAPWLALTIPTVLLLPLALLRTTWAMLDRPVTRPRKWLMVAVGVALLPVTAQFIWFLVTGSPHAATFEQARYAYLLTAVPYHAALLAVGINWVVEAIRAIPSLRTLAWTALIAVIPAVALTIRETFLSTDALSGPTLIGVTGLPLGLFASVSLVSRYVRAVRSQAQANPVTSEQYHRLYRLGAGGMGEAWLAQRAGEGGFRRWAVLKRIRIDNPEQALVERFLAEARVAARLHHANIVSVYDLGRYDDGLCIVMEYLPGLSLWDIMMRCYETRAFAPTGVVAAIGLQICRGLDCAHHHGVLHRDISPDNVIVTFDGTCKILDFGIAKEQGEPEPDSLAGTTGSSSSKTHAGSVPGKWQYMAPERIVGEPALPESDIFSVGLVLIQLLGAPIPKRGADLAGTPDPVSTHRPDILPAMEEVVRQALAAHPKQRYRSAAAMASDLRAVLAQCDRVDVGAWLRELWPKRWELQQRLDAMTSPKPAQVEALFARAQHAAQQTPRTTGRDGSSARDPTARKLAPTVAD